MKTKENQNIYNIYALYYVMERDSGHQRLLIIIYGFDMSFRVSKRMYRYSFNYHYSVCSFARLIPTRYF